MQKYLKFGIIASLVVGIVVAQQSGYFSEEILQESIQSQPVIAPLLFIVTYVIVTLSFLPATPLSLIGGAVFGAWFGSLYILLGAALGATLAFVLARFILREWVVTQLVKRFPKIQEYDTQLEKNGFSTVLFLRLIPLFPFNGLNFVLGVTNVSLREYVLATVLGIIPGVVVLSFLGDSLVARDPWAIILAIILYGGLACLGIMYKKLTHTKS